MKMSPMMMKLIEDKPVGNTRSIIYTTLQMAHLRLYVPELLEKIFSCRKVSRMEDGTLKLVRELLYKGGGGYNNNPGNAKVAEDLLMLQGMIEMELPDFRGKMIDKSDLERKWKSIRGYSPLEVRNGLDNADCGKYLNGDLLQIVRNNKQLITFKDTLFALTWRFMTALSPCSGVSVSGRPSPSPSPPRYAT